MDLTTEEIANKYGLAAVWPALHTALDEYAAQEAKSFQSWLDNQVLAGRTQHKLWLDYKAEVLDQRPTPSVSLLQEGAANSMSPQWCAARREEIRAHVNDVHGPRRSNNQYRTWLIELLSQLDNPPATLSQYQQERGGLPVALRTRLEIEAAAVVSEDKADEIRNSGGHADFDAAAAQGRAWLAAEILAATPTPVAIEEGGGAVDASRDLLPQSVTFDLPHEGAEVLLYAEGEPYPFRGNRIGLDAWHFTGYVVGPTCKITHFSYLPTAPAKKEAPNG